MPYILVLLLATVPLAADGFLQNLTDQYFEQGKYEKKEVVAPKNPTEPTTSSPTVNSPTPPVAPTLNPKENSSSSTTSLQDFTDRLFSQGKYKKNEEETKSVKLDSNTTKFQNFVDKLLKQNAYKEK